jgi:hypothetical protein
MMTMTEDTIIGTFIDDSGTEHTLSRREALIIADLKQHVESEFELCRMAKSIGWVGVAQKMLTVFSTPRSMQELWVWRRFQHAFGEGDTWEANRQLNYLFELTVKTGAAYYNWHKLPWFRILARYKAWKAFERCDAALLNWVTIARRTSTTWEDLEAFAAYGGPSALEWRLPESNVRALRTVPKQH